MTTVVTTKICCDKSSVATRILLLWQKTRFVMTNNKHICCNKNYTCGSSLQWYKTACKRNDPNAITASTEYSKSVDNKCDYLPGDLHCSAKYMAWTSFCFSFPLKMLASCTQTHKVGGKPLRWSPLLTDVLPLPRWWCDPNTDSSLAISLTPARKDQL